MGDEGVGVRAIERLQQYSFPDHVHLLDGGTGGFNLLSYFDHYQPIIMIDATMDERPPGTVTLLQPRFASDFPRTLSAHDIGLRDLIETAALLNSSPKIFLITISIKMMQAMTTELSPEVEESLPQVAAMVQKILAELENNKTIVG